MFEENEISIKSQGGTERMKRGVGERLPEGLIDPFQVICSRIRQLHKDKIRVLWVHDLPEDPELAHLRTQSSRDRFHHFVFCGNWQYYRFQHYLDFPYDLKSTVIDTAIDPIPYKPKTFDKIRMVYTSTPQRGLEILVPVFEELAKKYPNIHLDVFSSFKIYGWPEADAKYEPVYERIRNHPQMTYHGFAPNEVVKQTVQDSHIFAYPSIWPECNSQALIEAMSAGLLCVHPNFGGLIDTSGNLTMQYQGTADINVHANVFYQHLNEAINLVTRQEMQNYLMSVKNYADTRYNWEKCIGTWTNLLNSLREKYPTEESRALGLFDDKERFIYKVG